MGKKQELKIENNFSIDDIKRKLYKAISISDLASKEVTIVTKLKYVSTFLIIAIVYLITTMIKCSNGVKLSFSIISGLMYFLVIYIPLYKRNKTIKKKTEKGD